ncbi:MAG: hypothetical protein K0S65_6302 [Labilithrix sp.]|nr:hypothetical protein [Labilithrix sp.]
MLRSSPMSGVFGVLVGLLALGGCAHTPETRLHLAAPSSGTWVARDPSGARLCSLPCTVDLDEKESVVVAREGGQAFLVHQESLGAGTWSGSVRTRRELGAGALALQTFSGALVNAGTTMLQGRREDRTAAGIVLTGLGSAGMLASEALGKPREELWLERMGAVKD